MDVDRNFQFKLAGLQATPEELREKVVEQVLTNFTNDFKNNYLFEPVVQEVTTRLHAFIFIRGAELKKGEDLPGKAPWGMGGKWTIQIV